MMTTLFSSFVTFTAVAASPMPAAVQGTAAPSADKAAQLSPTPADTAYEPIRKSVEALIKSITNKRGVSEEDRPVISGMMPAVDDFMLKFPDDSRGPAAKVVLCTYLEDDACIDASFERLRTLMPDDENVITTWAQRLKSRGEYTRAAAVLEEANLDPAKQPRAVLMLSDMMFYDNRFEESMAMLNSVPASVIKDDPGLQKMIESAREGRQPILELWSTERAIREAEEAADDLPRVEISTPRGPIVLELFETQAYNTVCNFIQLAESGFYEGTTFHEVLQGIQVRGGDPNTKPGATGTPGMGTAEFYIPDEHKLPSARMHFAGSIAMHNTGASHSGSCQFYLTLTPVTNVNGLYTVFGRVISGLEVARKLQPGDRIEKVTVLRKKAHPYDATRFPKVPVPTKVEAAPSAPPAEPASESAPSVPVPTPR